MTDVARILGEFIAAWNAGRRPRMAQYLDRVPAADRDELAEQIETFLLLGPEPEYSQDDWDAMVASPSVAAAAAAAFGPAEPWPELLPRLRARMGLTWREVAERLRLPDTEKAAMRLEQMARGELDARGPTWGLLDRLAAVLGVRPHDLDWRGAAAGPSPRAAAALRGTDADAAAREQVDILADLFLADDEPLDDVDRAFLGGRD